MKKTTFNLVILSVIILPFAQAQDISFSGFHTDNPDGFSFVALCDIEAGEVFYFADGVYNAATNSISISGTGG